MAQQNPHDELLEHTPIVVHRESARTRIQMGRLRPMRTLVRCIGITAVLCLVVYIASAKSAIQQSGRINAVAALGGFGIAASGVLAYRIHLRRVRGDDDMTIDTAAGVLSIPSGIGRTFRCDIPLDRILSIRIADELPATDVPGLDAASLGARSYKLRQHTSPERADPDHRIEMLFAVVVVWRSDEAHEVITPVARWSDSARASALTDWLRIECLCG